MDTNIYVNKIVKKIKCSSRRKKKIKKELLTDIEFRIGQGENIEDIISQMGTIKEISDTFNENLPEKEKRNYKRRRILYIVFLIIILVIMGMLFLHWKMPKQIDIEQSKYFEKEQVESVVKNTIEQLENEEYNTLQDNAIEQMYQYLNKEFMDSIKDQVSDDWGSRKELSDIYMVEITQGNEHFVVAEVRVIYENVGVVYRLTYDQDMRLAGVYVR